MEYRFIYLQSGVYRQTLDDHDAHHITDRIFLGDLTEDQVDEVIDMLDAVDPYEYTIEQGLE